MVCQSRAETFYGSRYDAMPSDLSRPSRTEGDADVSGGRGTSVRRAYRGRFGQPVTDPEAIEARYVQEHLRRLRTKGIKAGRRYDQAVTVGELAKATQKTPEQIVAVINEFGMWLWYVNEIDGPVENWWVDEDGE